MAKRRRVLACLAVLALCASSCGVGEPSESGRELASEVTAVTTTAAAEPEDVQPGEAIEQEQVPASEVTAVTTTAAAEQVDVQPGSGAAAVDVSHAELLAVPGEATVIPDRGRVFVSWPAVGVLPGSPVAGYEVQWRARGEVWGAARRAVVVAESYELFGLGDGAHDVRVRPAVVERAEVGGASIVSAQGTAPRAEIVAPPVGFDEASSISAFDGVVNFEMVGDPVWPATIEIPVDLSRIEADDFIFLMSFNEEYGLWLPEPGAVFDPEAGVVTAEVDHLSLWGTFKKKVNRGWSRGTDFVREVRDDAIDKAKIVREVVVRPVVNAGRESIRFVYDKTKDVVYWTETGITYSMKAFQMSGEVALETARQYWEAVKFTAAVPDIRNMVIAWYERNIAFDRPACAGSEPEWVESVEKPAAGDPMIAGDPMVVCAEAAGSSGDLRLKVASQRYYPMMLTARVSGKRIGIAPDAANGIRVERTDGASDLSEVLVAWLIEVSGDSRYVLPVSATHWLRIPQSLGEHSSMTLKGEWTGQAHMLDTLLLAVDLLLTVSGKPTSSADIDLLKAAGEDIAECLSSDALENVGDEQQLWRTFSETLSCVQTPIQQATGQKGFALMLGSFAIVLWFLEGVTQLSGYIQQGIDMATGRTNPTVTINPVRINTEQTETQPATRDTNPTPTETSTVEHKYQAITAGYGHSCAITTGGDAVCWGRNLWGETDSPAGQYQAITAGYGHSCAITTGGDAVCWGNSEGGGEVPAGKYQAITAGSYHSCAITTAGDAVCWGANQDHNDLGQADAPAGKYQAIAAGGYHSCAITTAGDAVCWGANDRGQSDAPAGQYQTITAGQDKSCAITTTGDVVCWGANHRMVARWLSRSASAGGYQAIAAGHGPLCAITTTGDVLCYSGFSPELVPSIKYDAIAAGSGYSCAITRTGDVVCWGSNDHGKSEPPGAQCDVSGTLSVCG